MKAEERIRKMEEILDRAKEAAAGLDRALAVYEALRKDYKKLYNYYGSAQWMRDFEADENGKFPEDLPRGVLSEDAVYDLITEDHDLTIRMLRVATDTAALR